MDEKIASMAHDVLVADFVAQVQIEHDADMVQPGPVTQAMRDEILRRMGSRAERLDVLPDGHRV